MIFCLLLKQGSDSCVLIQYKRQLVLDGIEWKGTLFDMYIENTVFSIYKHVDLR